jgi:uncharacterized phage protein gp47/JayE
MATLAAQITSTGILAPDYANIYQQLRIQYWSIYGADANLDDDTQDGQFLAALAQIIYDCNLTAIDVYNSFSPAKAQGVGLSSMVKINGIRRAVPTNSTAVVLIIGQVGRRIENGQIGDDLGLNTVWNLPAIVDIPVEGEIAVTATAVNPGAVRAAAHSLTVILTPTLGWQSVDNENEAVIGQPVESDAELRARQSRSTALPAMTILEGIYAAVAAVQGVERLKLYENDTDVTDILGIPSHSIAVIASGGDVEGITDAIALKKAPGTGTAGTTERTVIDQNGVPNVIRYYELENVPMRVKLYLHPLVGFVSTTGDAAKQAVMDYLNGLDIGEDSYTNRLYSPANLGGTGLGATFVIEDIEQARDADPLSTDDVIITFREAAVVQDIADIEIEIV